MEKVENAIVMDGHPDIVAARRTAIKLADKPRIVVAMPIGGKPVIDVFEAPDGIKYANERGFQAQGLVPIQFVLSHMNWTPPLNVSMSYMVKMNMLSSHARQVMTMEAMRIGAEYIFYVDDDTLIPPLGLYTLYNWMERNPHAGAISGVYTTRETPNEPLIYQEHGAGCAWDFEMGRGAEPELIFGAGAGCLLARVSAIKAVMEQNPGLPVWADEKDVPSSGESSSVNNTIMWGHDIRFCRMLNLAGHPVYVHGQVLCGHHDIKTNTTYNVPDDAPGFAKAANRQRNINTANYWNQLYGVEGVNTWRTYEEMFQKVADLVGVWSANEPTTVTELGCGVGILGSKLTAEYGVGWRGYDISPTAVEMCRARFLDAHVLDLRKLTPGDLTSETVVMTEIIEHLERDAAMHVLKCIKDSQFVNNVALTVPDNCMGPEEIPEHTALFSAEYLMDMLTEAGIVDTFNVHVYSADVSHLLCEMTRK